MNLTYVVERQNAIISIQSEVINELFQILSQHIAVEELDALPVVNKINKAAVIRQEIE